MQELQKQLEDRDIGFPPAFGVALDVHGVDLAQIAADFEAQLTEALKAL